MLESCTKRLGGTVHIDSRACFMATIRRLDEAVVLRQRLVRLRSVQQGACIAAFKDVEDVAEIRCARSLQATCADSWLCPSRHNYLCPQRNGNFQVLISRASIAY